MFGESNIHSILDQSGRNQIVTPKLKVACRPGGIISKGFSIRIKPQKKVLNHYPGHYPSKGKMLRIVIWHLISGDWSSIEKDSEIEPPLTASVLLS